MKLKNNIMAIAAFYITQMVKEVSSVVGTYASEVFGNDDDDDDEEKRPEWKRGKRNSGC